MCVSFRLVLASATTYSRSGSNTPNRRFFDKVLLDAGASFSRARDGPRFMDALLEFDDEVDLLYRLTNPKARMLMERPILSYTSA